MTDDTTDLGTPPDIYSFRSHDEMAEDPNRLAEMFQAQHDQGTVAYRRTDGAYGVWLEGWLQTPERMAPFDPPETKGDA